MIYVRYTDKRTGDRSIVSIDEGRDAFAVLDEVVRKMFPNAAPQAPCIARSDSPEAINPGSAKATGRLNSVTPPPAHEPQAAGAKPGKSRDSEHRLPAQPAAAALRGPRDTSRIVYRALEYSGKISKQQRLLTEFFLANPQRTYTRQELVSATGVPINAICGRVHELMKKPLEFLVEVEKRECRITHEMVWALELRRTDFAIRRAA